MSGKFSKSYIFSVLAVITFARTIYSINWYTLSPGLTQVEAGFHASLLSLGILESSFAAGAAIFQVPAAYAASKKNAKLLAVLGLLVMCLSNGLSAFSPNLALLVALRFTLGLGAAMFFSPAIILVAPLFRSERQGLALGIYNSAFNLGGSIALLGWVFVIQAYGWRFGILLGAILLVPAIALILLVVRHTERDFGQAVTTPERSLIEVLKKKQIWYMGVGLVGLWSASYAITQFLPYFEIKVNLLEPDYAGLLAALTLLIPIPGSLIGGWLSDRFRNRKAFLLYPTIFFGIGTALIGYAGFNQSLFLLSSLGMLQSFAFVAMYAAPFQMEDLRIDQKTTSISLMNSVQIFGAFVLPILFTDTAVRLGYTTAWITAGIFTLAFVPLLLFVKEPFKRNREYRETVADG